MTEIEWLWTMKKPQVPLAQGLHVRAIPLMQKYWGISSDLPIKHVNGDIYFGKREVKGIYEEIKQKYIEDKKYPDKIYEIINTKIINIKSTIKTLNKVDTVTVPTEKLLVYFMQGYNAIAELTAFMSFKGTVQMSDVLGEKVQEILKRQMNDIEERNNVFLLLSCPSQDSFMIQEQKNILKIALVANKGHNIESSLKKHCEKFKWMGCVMYAGEPYTEQHFREEVSEASKKDCKQILENQERRKKQRDEQIKSTLTILQLTNEEIQAIKQFRVWIHLRTYIKDMTSVGMISTLPLLKEIATRVGCSLQDLLYLSPEEILSMFKKNKESFLKESKQRQKAWGFVLKNNQWKYYNNTTVKEIEEQEEILPKGVKGFPACRGIVQGRAIIVKTVEDLQRVEDGNVLITHMTTTNFIPILSRVVAIVTDEGGITCHAAIVSREMNIPCVIGTKFATKSFKDGDFVEVDAEKGIVKKISE